MESCDYKVCGRDSTRKLNRPDSSRAAARSPLKTLHWRVSRALRTHWFLCQVLGCTCFNHRANYIHFRLDFLIRLIRQIDPFMKPLQQSEELHSKGRLSLFTLKNPSSSKNLSASYAGLCSWNSPNHRS